MLRLTSLLRRYEPTQFETKGAQSVRMLVNIIDIQSMNGDKMERPHPFVS